LKDKTDLLVAKLAQYAFLFEGKLFTAKQDFALGRMIESAENVQQSALADSGLADDRQPLALGQIEIDAAQNVNLAVSFDEGLVQISDGKEAIIHTE